MREELVIEDGNRRPLRSAGGARPSRSKHPTSSRPSDDAGVAPPLTSSLTLSSLPRGPSSLNLQAVGPSPTLKNFRNFTPPDMGQSLASLDDDEGFAASLLTQYYSESYQKSRRGMLTSSALPEGSMRQLGRIAAYGSRRFASSRPSHINSLESYSKAALFVEPVWMGGGASRSTSRGGGKRRGKMASSALIGKKGGVILPNPTAATFVDTPVSTNGMLLNRAGGGNDAEDESIEYSSMGSFTMDKSSLYEAFSSTAGSRISIDGNGSRRPKTTGGMMSFKYSMVSTPALPPKKKTYASSAILARLSNPNGDFDLSSLRKSHGEDEGKQVRARLATQVLFLSSFPCYGFN